MKNLHLLLTVSIFLALQSCTKTVERNFPAFPKSDTLLKQSDSVNIYVAGGIFRRLGNWPCHRQSHVLEKRGPRYPGQFLFLCHLHHHRWSGRLSVGDVSRGDPFDKAIYWKNGNAVTLTDGSTNARITSILVDGPDVYASGWISAANGLPVAVYWKNNVLTILSDSSFYAVANGIAVIGSDVYVAGQFMNGHMDSSTVICWKNGVALPLSAYPFSYATSVVASGNDLYLGGVSSTANGFSNTASYWKNGVLVSLTTGSFGNQVNSIAVNGDSVYAAGFFGQPNNSAAFWQNGIAIPLSGVTVNYPVSPGMVTSYASSVTTHGQDIYVAGGTNNIYGNYRALYWKNGLPFFLNNGADSTGFYAMASPFNKIAINPFLFFLFIIPGLGPGRPRRFGKLCPSSRQ